MNNNDILNKVGYLHVKDIIDIKLCNYLTSALLLNSVVEENKPIDPQSPDSITVLKNNILFDTLLENIWPVLEENLQEELIPTYSYARLYQNGNKLKNHMDRPACEISMTIQLGRSHHYSWPIFMNDTRFDLEEGSGIIYKGCEIHHYREECKGPEGYYSGQVFLHYVRANGQFKEWAGDKQWEKHPFIRNRNFLMNVK